jgi:dTDP-4-amino-4,6-dideoxygalactose transaminase
VVPVVDLSRRGARFADRFGAVAARIAGSGSYLLGAELESFESELAAWLGADHVVGVASGAAALQLALTGAGIGPGHDVLVPAFTAVPTASAVIAAGARPVVVDVDPATACITPDAIAAARTSNTTAVIVVHLYGYPAPLPGIDLRALDLMVIEDAAQAHGAVSDHSRSTAVAYSFYPTKNLGGIGDGGAVVTADPALAERVRRLRVHGMTQQYVHESISQNFRMSELEAAWLRMVLPELDDDIVARRRIGDRYREAAPHLRWQTGHPRHAHHLCVFRSDQRRQIRQQLAGAGVATAVHYPLALTQQPAFRSVFGEPAPQAEAWAAECVSVPCFPEMTDVEIDTVAAALAVLPS